MQHDAEWRYSDDVCVKNGHTNAVKMVCDAGADKDADDTDGDEWSMMFASICHDVANGQADADQDRMAVQRRCQRH